MSAILTRSAHKKVILSERDQAVVRSVFDLREAQFAGLWRLHFPECVSDTPLQRCLARLTRTGFLTAKRMQMLGTPGRQPYCYIAGRAAVPFLAQSLNLPLDQVARRERQDERLSELFYPHRSLVTDIRISLLTSCQTHGWSLSEWHGEEEFRQRREQVELAGKTAFLFPDAFCVVDVGERAAPLFIEAQNHSKPAHFRDKIALYTAYVDSGAFTQTWSYRSVRVLAVTDTRERAWNLKRLADSLPASSRFWSASVEDIRPDILTAPVWFVGGEATQRPLI